MAPLRGQERTLPTGTRTSSVGPKHVVTANLVNIN